MSKILDLNAFRDHTLDIKMLDGSTVHIPKPTQRVAIEFTAMEQAAVEPETQIDYLKAKLDEVTVAALRVLNTNQEHRTFTRDDLADYSMEVLSAIVRAYSKFLVEVQSDPN